MSVFTHIGAFALGSWFGIAVMALLLAGRDE